MNDYPKDTWSDEEVEKMKRNYIFGEKVVCPIDGESVSVTKEEGERYLSRKYINTCFFLTYECKGCGRRDSQTLRKSPYS